MSPSRRGTASINPFEQIHIRKDARSQITEVNMDKDSIIKKIKSGSLFSAIICALAAAVNVVASLSFLKPVYVGQGQKRVVLAYGGLQGYMMWKNSITFAMLAVTMLIAAVMFFRISQTGKPFTGKLTKLTRLVGILLIANAIVPGLIAFVITGFRTDTYPLMLNPSSLIEGLLFLFIAYVIHYGALLQQESDETL